MGNGMNYVADWLIWPNSMLLETVEILAKYKGKRTLVYKKDGKFYRLGD